MPRKTRLDARSYPHVGSSDRRKLKKDPLSDPIFWIPIQTAPDS